MKLKYILIEHADGNDPKVLRIFSTPEERVRATREAILGPPDDSVGDKDILRILEALTEEGIMRFEGDPPIEWVDAEVILE